MIAKVVFTSVVTSALIFAAISPVEAHVDARHHSSFHHLARGAYNEPMEAADGVGFAPMRSYQAYAGYRSRNDVIPHDPLIPLRQETPPPVDPNEAVSGSYGAMVNGYDSAGAHY